MADKPNILLVFSNAAKDLDGVQIECKTVGDILYKSKWDSLCFDYHSHENKSLMEVIYETEGRKNYTASLFHFSGHADEQALLFTGGTAKVTTICSVLREIKTRFVFLNGCCTEGFLEALFNETGVVAAIVTNSKVGDKLAANLSVAFYTSFIERQNTLYRSFVCIRDGCGSVLHEEGFNMSKRTIKLKDHLPNKDAGGFQWSLYYKDPSFRDITIHNIQSKGSSGLEQISKLLEEKKAELKVAETKLNKLALVKDQDAFFMDEYKKQEVIVLNLVAEIKRLDNEQRILVKEKFFNHQQTQRQRLSDDLTRAIKNINYITQRNIYKTGKHCSFACYAVISDEDALVDLLLLKMEEEYGFQQGDLFAPEINYNSAIGRKFWPALAWEVGAKEDDTPEQIIRTLITRHFLYTDQSISQQHIFLKIKFKQIDLEKIPALVSDFWNKIKLVCDQLPVFSDRSNLLHKIFVILINESGDRAQHEALRRMTASINIQLASTMASLPWVLPLEQHELQDWINKHELDKVGIDPHMAEDIYKESNNGKIRRVLASVKKRCEIQDLELFKKLNIITDDGTESLFGENGE